MLMETRPAGRTLEMVNELDLAFELPGEGRFRVNISRQRRFFNIVLRVIPLQIRTFEELNLPSVLRDIALGPARLRARDGRRPAWASRPRSRR